MATLNFNLLGLDRPGIAQRFMMGQQEAQAEAERNMLRQAQMQQIQQQNTLAAQQLAEYERARREEEGVRNYFAQARTVGEDVTSPEFMRGLYGVSPKAAATYEQTVATRQKATTEEAARRAKLAIDKTAMYRNQVPNLKTREDAVKWIQAQVADPDMAGTPVTKVPLMDAVRGIPQDPAEFEQWKQRAGMTFDQFIDYNKPLVVGQSIMTRGGQIVATAPRPSQLLSPEEERQRIRIAQASRPPDSPKEPSKGVKVVDPNDPSKIIYVSAEDAIRLKLTPAEAQEGLTVKERQRREAVYPQAKQAVEGFETKSEKFIKDLERLRDDPGLNQITGPVYGRTPSVSAAGSRAQALYDKIFAKGGFQALQDMREASKTGGALGNVSNEEGRRLEKSVVGGLDRKQNINDVKQGINDLIDEIRTSKARVRNAYDTTYEYRQGAESAPAAAPTSAPATTFPTPPAAAVDALKRGVGTDAQFDAIFGPGAAARARGR